MIQFSLVSKLSKSVSREAFSPAHLLTLGFLLVLYSPTACDGFLPLVVMSVKLSQSYLLLVLSVQSGFCFFTKTKMFSRGSLLVISSPTVHDRLSHNEPMKSSFCFFTQSHLHLWKGKLWKTKYWQTREKDTMPVV